MKRKILLAVLALVLLVPMMRVAAVDDEYTAVDPLRQSLFTTLVPGARALDGRFVPTLDAFQPLRNIALPTTNPEDFFLCNDSYTFFIADTGASRILVFDPHTGDMHDIGTDVLRAPFGVAATADRVYVADAGLEAVIVFDRHSGEEVLRILRPTSPFFGTATGFVPRKIATDARGNIYVISDNSPNGVMQFTPEGYFLGFVGENRTQLGWWARILRTFQTEAQRAQLIDLRPPTPTNLAINRDGLLITTTTGEMGHGIKKFSAAGLMLLHLYDWHMSAVAPDARGNIYAISPQGFSLIVDMHGQPLFVSQTSTVFYEMEGVTRTPVATVVGPTGVWYILDRELSALVRYQPTPFGTLVLDASYLLAQGRFLEGEALWREVEELNATFRTAHLALGFADYRLGNFPEARDRFRISEYATPTGFSRVIWYIRNEWLLSNLQWTLLAMILLWALNASVRFYCKKKKILHPLKRLVGAVGSRAPVPVQKFGREVRNAFYFCRHPFDAVYEIKFNQAVGLKTAIFLYAMFLFVFVLSTQATSFTFHFTSMLFQMPLVLILLAASVPFILGIIASFLISDIKEGEATFRQVVIIVACALIPYTVLLLVRTIISHGLTLNEQFVYQFIGYIGVGWTAFLVVGGLKEAYNYNVRGISVNLLLTAFSGLCMVLVFSVAAMLVTQEMTFLRLLFGEVVLRVQA